MATNTDYRKLGDLLVHTALVLFQITWVGCADIEKAASRALGGWQTRGSLYIAVSGGGYITEMTMSGGISITRRTYCSHTVPHYAWAERKT